MTSYYFEDFTPGRVFELAPRTISAEEIIEFAREFDPAPFHLNEEEGKRSMLGGLAASGWHICSISMRMMCDAFMLDSSGQGSPGIDKCRWLAPVFAGDTITGRVEVTMARASASRPKVGVVNVITYLEKIDGTPVAEFSNAVMMGRREQA